MDFLVLFAHTHLDFRIPELLALAESEQVTLLERGSIDDHTCLLRVKLASWADAKRLVAKSILIKAIYEVWAEAEDYASLRAAVAALPAEISHQHLDRSWRFDVVSPGNSLTAKEQVERIQHFDVLPYPTGPTMKNAEVVYSLVEFYSMDPLLNHSKVPMLRVAFCLLVGTGNRQAVNTYTLKRRPYIGITSLDAEMAAIMANMAHLKKSKLAYDPFMGTGGLGVAAAANGAFVLGSDIDGYQLKGVRKGNLDIVSNMEHYGLSHLYLGSFMADMSSSAAVWERTLFDAIVTDPPYGVRAGAKKVGGQRDNVANQNPERYPTVVTYQMLDIIGDLMKLAARTLHLGGRLVFLMPTMTRLDKVFDTDQLPRHTCLALVAASEQKFNQWSRILVTMKKVCAWSPNLDVVRIPHREERVDFRNQFFEPRSPQSLVQ